MHPLSCLALWCFSWFENIHWQVEPFAALEALGVSYFKQCLATILHSSCNPPLPWFCAKQQHTIQLHMFGGFRYELLRLILDTLRSSCYPPLTVWMCAPHSELTTPHTLIHPPQSMCVLPLQGLPTPLNTHSFLFTHHTYKSNQVVDVQQINLWLEALGMSYFWSAYRCPSHEGQWWIIPFAHPATLHCYINTKTHNCNIGGFRHELLHQLTLIPLLILLSSIANGLVWICGLVSKLRNYSFISKFRTELSTPQYM